MAQVLPVDRWLDNIVMAELCPAIIDVKIGVFCFCLAVIFGYPCPSDAELRHHPGCNARFTAAKRHAAASAKPACGCGTGKITLKGDGKT